MARVLHALHEQGVKAAWEMAGQSLNYPSVVFGDCKRPDTIRVSTGSTP